MKRLVVFDWDGTLCDSEQATLACISTGAQNLQLPIPNEKIVRSLLGLKMLDLLQRLYPDLGQPLLIELKNAVREASRSRPSTAPLFSSAIATAKKLSQEYNLAIVSNRSMTSLAATAVEHPRLFKYISCFQGTAPPIQPKPDPALLFKVMSELRVLAQDTIFVGDSIVDLMAAENAGIPFIGIRSLAQADHSFTGTEHIHLINDLSELPSVLKKLY